MNTIQAAVGRLARWNEHADTPRLRCTLAAAVFLGAAGALFWSIERTTGLNSPPPIGGDAVIYDALAWQLAHGHGFALDVRDPQFLEPYLDADEHAARRLAETAPQGPIASRPPLLPLIMAGFNRAFGRQFWGVRVVNIAVMAVVAAFIAGSVCRLAGPIPALVGVVHFLVIDPRVRVATREILTESHACLLIALLAIILVRLIRFPRVRTALLAGAVIGAAMLLRTMFVLWIPVLALFVAVATRSAPNNDASATAPAWKLSAIVIVAALAAFAPWGWRNCRVLDRFMPLGTQGTMELSAGYSAAAWERWGMWHNLEETGFFASVDSPGQSALEREMARANYSRSRAMEWCRSHPLQAAVLPLMKIFQEFRPHMSGDLYVLAFALLGLVALRGTPEGRVWLAIVAATAFAVAATWSVAGRFLVPSLYVLHSAAAIGAWNALLACAADSPAPQYGAGTPDV